MEVGQLGVAKEGGLSRSTPGGGGEGAAARGKGRGTNEEQEMPEGFFAKALCKVKRIRK